MFHASGTVDPGKERLANFRVDPATVAMRLPWAILFVADDHHSGRGADRAIELASNQPPLLTETKLNRANSRIYHGPNTYALGIVAENEHARFVSFLKGRKGKGERFW